MSIKTATEAHAQLELLTTELAEARRTGLLSNRAYREDLAHEIATCEAAFVGLAVTEIAAFRAELSGPQLG